MERYRIDADLGVVYGPQGLPIRRTSSRGYIQVNDSRGKHVASGHRMIWEHIHGPIPKGMVINHKNGVKTDNRIENLEVVTHTENMRHARRTGLLSNAGEKNGRAKLSNADVTQIRDSDLSAAAIAQQFGVSQSTVSAIRTRTIWSHVA